MSLALYKGKVVPVGTILKKEGLSHYTLTRHLINEDHPDIRPYPNREEYLEDVVNRILGVAPNAPSKETLERLRDENVYTKDIAYKYDMNVDTLRLLCLAYGISTKYDQLATSNKSLLTKEALEEIYLRLKSTDKVAAEVGVSGTTILNKMKEFGIPTLKERRKAEKAAAQKAKE